MSKYLVFGHRNPDSDAIGSAISLAYYLNQKGYEAEAVALGEANDETSYALNYFGLDAPRVVETVSNETDRVALVDHNEFQQSASDIEKVQIDFVVDHHRIQNFHTAQPLFYRAEAVGCTSTVLYKMYQENNVEIPQNIGGMMLSAILSDTLIFKSPTCTQDDIDAANALADIAGVDIQQYGLDLLRAGTNFANKTDEFIINSDAKNFTLNNYDVRVGQVNVIGFDEILERKDSLLSAMKKDYERDNLDMFLLVLTDVLDSTSLGLVVGERDELIKDAFGYDVINDQVDLPDVVSRKKQIIPPLTNSYNKEDVI